MGTGALDIELKEDGGDHGHVRVSQFQVTRLYMYDISRWHFRYEILIGLKRKLVYVRL